MHMRIIPGVSLLRSMYNNDMCKVYVPYAHAKSIFEIEIDFYKKHGIKTVLSDLDNTLDSYKTRQPSARVVSFKQTLEENGIELFIISNNTGKRVQEYANALGVRYASSVGKPFAKKLKRKLKEAHVDLKTAVMIGDQTVTDIASANRAGILSILTDKIVKEDQPTTHFNRLFDRPIRRHLRRKGKLIDWRER